MSTLMRGLDLVELFLLSIETRRKTYFVRLHPLSGFLMFSSIYLIFVKNFQRFINKKVFIFKIFKHILFNFLLIVFPESILNSITKIIFTHRWWEVKVSVYIPQNVPNVCTLIKTTFFSPPVR